MTDHDTQTQTASESSEESSVRDKQWLVHCDDCDLEREYEDEQEALEKMLAHTDVLDHGAAVKEVSA